VNISSPKKTIVILVFLVIIWGLNWPLTKLALNDAPPILFSGLRTLLGGLILLIFALRNYRLLRFKEMWKIYGISTLLNVIVFYGLQTIGIEYLPAGMFSAILYVQPVLLGIFSWLWLGESMYGIKIVGLLLGFIGVTVICVNGIESDLSIIGILLALSSAIVWGIGTVYIKKIGDRVDAIWLVTVQFIIGGIVLLGVGSGVESWSTINWSIAFISNLLFIAAFVIALGWLAYFSLMRFGEVSKIGAITFLIPLVAIVSSVFILKESITSKLLIGLLFIIISICCVNLTPKSIRIKPNEMI